MNEDYWSWFKMAWQDQNKNKPRKVYTVTITVETHTVVDRDDVPTRVATEDVMSMTVRNDELKGALHTAQGHLKLYVDNLPDKPVFLDPSSR